MNGILYDVTKCKGCMECVAACAVRATGDSSLLACDVKRDDLSAKRPSTIVRGPGGRWVRRHCQHCLEPSCASACLVGALRKTPEGPVVYDPAMCIGCRYCMIACPFSFPKYEWERSTPLMRKCDLCFDRPGGPACAAACTQGAAKYGGRADLLALAKRTIAADPDRYVQHVYGETEMGGTCVLFISDVDLAELWPAGMGTHSIPELTKPFVATTPWVALGVAGGLSVLSWVIHRRDKILAETADAARQVEA